MNDDYGTNQSPDDALEPEDEVFDPLRDEEKLPGDYDSPATPAQDIRSGGRVDEPSTDDEMDSDELYQEGVAGATNAQDEEIQSDEGPFPLEPED